jgi:hypothetical protein
MCSIIHERSVFQDMAEMKAEMLLSHELDHVLLEELKEVPLRIIRGSSGKTRSWWRSIWMVHGPRAGGRNLLTWDWEAWSEYLL